MENRAQALLAGFFTLGVAALAIALGLWLSRDTRERTPFEIAATESVAGLVPQAAVTYKGLPVGKVTRIGLSDQEPGRVIVSIRVEANVPITASTYAQLAYQGVTGLTYIALDDSGVVPQKVGNGPGPVASAAVPVTLPKGPSGVPRIPLKPSLLTTLAGQGEALVGRVGSVLGRANDWLAPENQQRFASTLASFEKAAQGAARLADEARPVVAKAGRDLGQVSADTSRTLATIDATAQTVNRSAQVLTQQVTAPGGTLERANAALDATAQAAAQANASTLPRMQNAADETTRTGRSVQRATSALAEEPSAVIFGRSLQPGPGEPGFVAPVGALPR
jgi:phospholipid/cholesterol/gamma-HCH transport system substrate-binding protein